MQKEMKAAESTLPPKARVCGNCGLGEPIHVPGELRPKILCRAGYCAAMPVLDPITKTPSVRWIRPIWDAKTEWCHLFMPKEPQ